MKTIQNKGYEFEIDMAGILENISQNLPNLAIALASGDQLLIGTAMMPFTGMITCVHMESSRGKLLYDYIQGVLNRTLPKAFALIPSDKLQQAQLRKLGSRIKPEKKQIQVDFSLMERPGESEVSKLFLEELCALLSELDADLKSELEQIRIAWPGYFAESAGEEWTSKPAYADELSEDQIFGPMQTYIEATQAEQEYKQALCRKMTEGIYDGSCTLNDLYIDLQAKYQMDGEDDRICFLEQDLLTWACEGIPGMVVVEGDPGSGKSTVLKKLAKELVCKGKHVVYIDLFRVPFSNNGSGLEVIEKYISGRMRWYQALDLIHDPNTVLIFDGLDEIKASVWDNSKELAVQLPLSEYAENHKIILSGRIKIIEHCASELSGLGRYTILPLADEETEAVQDLRVPMWEKLSAHYGLSISLQKLLWQKHLKELSKSPLLLYLLAWTFHQDPDAVEGISNSVQLYRQILECTYRRQHGRTKKELAGNPTDYENYCRILRAVGTCAWMYNSRSIELSRVKDFCRRIGLESEYRKWFSDETEKKTSRLFLMFFAHEEQNEESGSSFEFLHKSFYEFFAAEEILDQILLLEKLGRDKAIDRMWSILGNEGYVHGPVAGFLAAMLGENPEYLNDFASGVEYAFALTDLIPASSIEATQCMKLEGTDRHTLNFIIGKRKAMYVNIWELISCGSYSVEMLQEMNSVPYFVIQGLEASNQILGYLDASYTCFLRCRIEYMSIWLSNMRNTKMQDHRCLNCILPTSNFDDSSWRKTQIYCSSFAGSTFRNADISESVFRVDMFNNCDFTATNIHDRILFAECDFSNTILIGTQIRNTKFIECRFIESYFAEVDCSNVKFEGCQFLHAKFRNVKMSSFDLSDENLVAALSKADLTQADWSDVPEEIKNRMLHPASEESDQPRS